MKILIKGGRVVDPKNDFDKVADVLVDNGVISEIGENINADGDVTVIDAEGKIVSPGLVDMHSHLRDPGQEYKEDIESGTRSAAMGGITSIACMPNTKPVTDSEPIVTYIKTKAKEVGHVNVYPIGSISKGLEGKELAEIGELKNAGAVAISDDGRPVVESGLMRRALEYAKMFDIAVISHCEDLGLADGGQMNEGFMATYLGLKGITRAAEEVMVSRDILIAEATHTAIHIAHVSTRGSVELVRQAKKRGVNVTCETCPHYFTLTENAVDGFNTNAKMNPPLRTSDDVEAIKEALPYIQGRKVFINSISTDKAYEALLPMIKETGASVVCLPIAGREIPAQPEGRLKNADLLIEKLTAAGIATDNIYVDVLVEALATEEKAAATTLKTIRLMKEKYPEIQTICGLSNISFGLPNRANLNAAFLAMALVSGLDAAILDCSSPRIQDMLYMAEALLGRDEYCMEYIGYCRENM